MLFTEGVLQGFLQDRMLAAKMGVEPTGNARRESYAHPPIVADDEHEHPARPRGSRETSVSTPRGIYVRRCSAGAR